MQKYIDIHTHPLKEYYEDPEKEVQNWKENQIDLILATSTDKKEFFEIKNLAEKFSWIKPVYGIHPSFSQGKEDSLFLEKNIQKKPIAVGEIGLDFFYKDNPEKNIQIESFVSQIELAKKWELPVIIHSRNSINEVFQIITQKKYENVKFIFHTFSENLEWAKKLSKLKNIYLSFSGVLTFKNAKKTQEVAKFWSLDKLFLETDSPFLTPHPLRGQKNSSKNIKLVYKYMANLKNIQEKELIEIVKKNFLEVFKNV